MCVLLGERVFFTDNENESFVEGKIFEVFPVFVNAWPKFMLCLKEGEELLGLWVSETENAMFWRSC